eukprot:s2776_g14.t1
MTTVGINFTDETIGVTIMPAPGPDGRPQQRPLATDEASSWLRLLLGEEQQMASSARKISSHSLKSTILSFAAKRGLGYVDTYARDAQARVIRLVDKLIIEVRSGYFEPDCNRAGRFNHELKGHVFKSQALPPAILEGTAEDLEDLLDEAGKVVSARPEESNSLHDLDESHMTSETSNSSSEQSEGLVGAHGPRSFHPPSPPDGLKFVQHRKTKALHYVDYKFPAGTVCGRTLTSDYVPPRELRYDSAVCHSCTRSHKPS